MNDLSTATTTIRAGKEQSRPISIKRGVKQGDPMSPIIFNLVMDELLCQLEELQGSATLDENNANCPYMAFADDLLLLTNAETYAHT